MKRRPTSSIFVCATFSLLSASAFAANPSAPDQNAPQHKPKVHAVKKKKAVSRGQVTQNSANPFPQTTPQTRIPSRPNASTPGYSLSLRRGSVRVGREFPETTPQNRIPQGVGVTAALQNATGATKAEFSITGYAKGEFIYDFTKDNLGTNWAPRLIALGNNNTHARLFAGQSRLRFKSKAYTDIGLMNTWIEADFNGPVGDELLTNSNLFRLRMAWGEWYITPTFSVRVGQDNTTFASLLSFPETIDFNGAVGNILIRQPQVRLTYEKNKLAISVSAENPEGTFTTVGGGYVPAGTICAESFTGALNTCGANDEMPDFAARIQYATPHDRAMFQISGLLRELTAGTDKGQPLNVVRYAHTTGTSSTGYGLLGGLKFNLNKFLAITATGVGGNGIGRYLWDGGFFQGGLFNTQTEQLNLIRMWGGNASLIIKWTKTLRTNLVYGMLESNVHDLGGITGMITKDKTFHANLIWQPVERMQMGVESIWGKVYPLYQQPRSAYRFQAAAWFYF